MRIVSWINRHLTHNRDDEGDYGIRVLIHIPAGLLMGIPILGWGLIKLFLTYERNEDAHTQDEAWKDIMGAMVGYAIMQLVIIIAGLVLIRRLPW